MSTNQYQTLCECLIVTKVTCFLSTVILLCVTIALVSGREQELSTSFIYLGS